MGPKDVNSIDTIETGNWQHLVVVFSTSKDLLSLYRNGVLIDSQTGTFSLDNSAQSLFFGKEGDIGRHFKGSLDDIRIYNKSLTMIEIQNLFYESTCFDTIYDTISINDTIVFNDTVTVLDTMVIYDSIAILYDTIIVNDTATINDTIIFNDTVTILDTIIVYDSIAVFYDTITINDTISIYQDTNTITLYDTISVTDTLFIDFNITSINSNILSQLKVYPNPTSSSIFIESKDFNLLSNYRLEVKNTTGQSIFISLINQEKYELNLSTWGGAGLYFLYLIDDQSNTVVVKKIILQ